MEYRILGPLAVLRNGEELTLGGLRQRAVLAVLLLADGRAVDADRLIDQVWGGDAPPKPLASLRSYLTNLRRLIGDDVLRREGAGYLVDTSAAVVDGREFGRLVAAGRRQLQTGDAAQARDTFGAALALWRGPPLSDFGDHHFAAPEIHRLAAARIDALEEYYDAALTTGETAGILAGLEAETAANPLREKFWWQLMLARYRSGHRTDALRAYARVSEVLDVELGVTPGTALERLATDIRNESPALDWQRHPENRGATEPHPFGGLFGRTAETRRLQAALRSAVDGHGGIVIVSGDSGMGKTMLVQHLAAIADRLGMATVWAGHAAEMHRPPSWAWAHAVRQLGGQLPAGADGRLHATLPSWWSVATEDASAGEVNAGNRFDVLDATAAALAELASRRPALVVLDDLQRADRFTLDVLEHIAAAGRLLPLLILATWQEDAADGTFGLREFDRLRSRTDVEFVKLRGLCVDDTAAVITDMCDVAPTPEFVVDVHARTGGNPFFIRELVRLLIDNGRVGVAIDGEDVPEAVSGVIRRRLARLPAASRAVLDAAAVLGAEFPVARLAAVQGSTTAVVIDVLTPAFGIGLLAEPRQLPGVLRFSHGLVRDAIAAEITGTERARLHADIARSFARQRGDVTTQDAIDGAEHAWRASGELDSTVALELLDRARADAWSRSAYREVAELDRRALTVCGRLPAASERFEREVDLQLQLASVEAVVTGQSSANVLAGMKKSGLEVVQSTAAVAMGCLEACGTGRYHDAAVLSDSLVEFFEITADPIAGAAGYYIRALTDFMRGKLDVATISIRTMQATVPPVNRDLYGALASFEVIAYGVASHAAGLLGDVVGAQGLLTAGIAIGSEHGDAFGTAVLRTADIQLCAMLGSTDGLCERAALVVRELTEMGIDQFIGGARIIGAWARATGPDAIDTVEEMYAALELHGRGGRRIFAPLYLGLLSDALATHRDLVSAHDALTRAETMAAATGERVWDAQLSARRLRLVARAHQRADSPAV